MVADVLIQAVEFPLSTRQERRSLPLIRRVRPDCSLTIVGRTPPPSVAALAREDGGARNEIWRMIRTADEL